MSVSILDREIVNSVVRGFLEKGGEDLLCQVCNRERAQFAYQVWESPWVYTSLCYFPTFGSGSIVSMVPLHEDHRGYHRITVDCSTTSGTQQSCR